MDKQECSLLVWLDRQAGWCVRLWYCDLVLAGVVYQRELVLRYFCDSPLFVMVCSAAVELKCELCQFPGVPLDFL